MKHYIILENEQLHIIGAQGFIPRNTVVELPNEMKKERVEWLDIISEQDEITGAPITRVQINATIKKQILDNEKALRDSEKQKGDEKQTEKKDAGQLLRKLKTEEIKNIADVQKAIKLIVSYLKQLE